MAITYKTVIVNAIKGFNDIQNKIYTNSGQLVAPANSADSGVSSVSDILGALNSATLTAEGSASFTAGSNSNGGGNFAGVAPASSGEAYTLATSAYSVVNSQDTSNGTYYYIKGTASGSGSKTITPSASVKGKASSAGLVKLNQTAAAYSSISGTASSVSCSGSSTKYIKIPKATFTKSGGKINVNTAGYIQSGTVGTVSASDVTSGNIELKAKSGTDVTNYKTASVKSGSATTPTASGASSNTSLSGTTITVARSVTPDVSAGWVSSGTAGTVTITGTVPTETKTASSAGTINATSGKLMTAVTVPAGEAHNGYVTKAGWIAKDTQYYTLSYDSTNKCVDFIFNN